MFPLLSSLPPKLWRTASLAALALLGQFVFAQANPRARSWEAYDTNRNNDSSDLAKENLNRVAASALQIRDVLTGDAGLLVELKQWVAKEATDNGQVIQESDLSDQAIFDRLEHDVVFRSVATRLLQRYGYLLPSLKVDSPMAKEQELLLQERVRRLAKIEEQEDNDSRLPRKTEQREIEPSRNCDPEQD